MLILKLSPTNGVNALVYVSLISVNFWVDKLQGLATLVGVYTLYSLLYAWLFLSLAT